MYCSNPFSSLIRRRRQNVLQQEKKEFRSHDGEP